MNNNDPKYIRLYAVLHRTRALGPFFRFAIWLQGCPRHCKGCMSPEARPFDAGYLADIHTLSDQIIAAPDIDGITVSGGEPFMQPESLIQLIDAVRRKRDIGVILYTGYVLGELRETADTTSVHQLLDCIDLLIDGPYIQELDDGLSLRGSSNQIIHPLTNRYAEMISEYYGQPQRNTELHLLKNEVFLAGIPGTDTLKQWKSVHS
jgi:anaerobic ribonucleoside-triphosphate reductase activating protein